MKYWIFQSNQVLGPYSPEDLSRLPSFNAESLVCPEGRKGTSMGDWQRAGMVPDLSVALVKASSAHNIKTPVASLAGLPPEPTLKDLAVLGSLQEKMAMLEDVVLQLQEGLRVKDAELANLHVELAGKSQESTEIKRDAEQLRRETELRRREAEVLKAETEEFKRRIADLEERASTVGRLTETIDKAVEAEKHVEHDVEVQGSALAGLTQEIESLRAQMRDRLASASAISSVAPAGLPESGAASFPDISPAAKPSDAPPDIAPAPVKPPEALKPDPAPASPAAEPPLPDIAPDPTFGLKPPLPSYEATAPMPSFSSSSEPAPSPASGVPAGMISFDPLAPQPAAPPPVEAGPVDAVLPPTPAPSRKKALVIGLLLGIAALAGLAFYSGMVPGFSARQPAADIATPAPMPAPVEAPAPEPPPDERQTAIDFAKQWSVKNGSTLGQVLETLSPSNGNLSPWMAEPLSSGRVQVNYFARGSAPGSPTVAYEFEVDLTAKNVSGRNTAAKAVIAGKAVPPPAPKKPKSVKVKAKPAAPKPEESLDSLLGEPGAAPTSAPAPAPEAKEETPPEAPAEPAAKPAKPQRAKRAAKAAKEAEGSAEDASLLDDLLKE